MCAKSVSKSSKIDSKATGSGKAKVVSTEKILDSLKNISQVESFNDFSSIASAIGISQLLIIESESHLRVKRLTSFLIEKICSLLPDVEKESFSGLDFSNEKKLSSFIFSLNNDGLFSKAKIITIKDADSIKVAQVSSILNALPLSSKTFLIFQCKKVPSSENWKKLCSNSSICPLKEFSSDELKKWVFQEAKKRGVKGISTEGLMYLVNDVSTNLETLDQIIEKASLLINSKEEIDLETLKKVSETSINKDTFELFNAIAKKDHLAADLILNSILQSGTHPLQILGFFNKAIKSIVIKNSQSSSTEPVYFPDLNNAWFVKKLSPERFTKERLQKALKILAELDSDIKGKNYSESGCLHGKLVYI